jgi:3-hydroxyisobutyrate dehydrogenase
VIEVEEFRGHVAVARVLHERGAGEPLGIRVMSGFAFEQTNETACGLYRAVCNGSIRRPARARMATRRERSGPRGKPSNMSTIAWYGAGLMGAGFVEALRRRGHDVVVWNRTFEKARALEAFGARAVADPREAARGATRAHVMIADDDAVDGLLARLDGAFDPGTIVVDHSTVAPGPTRIRFETMAKRGVPFFHAPVFMAPKATREATGVMLGSGPAALFATLEPELAPMTGKLVYLGERTDKAATLKLVGNQMLFFIAAGLADSYAMAKSNGVSTAEAYELFSSFNPGVAIGTRGKAMAENNFEASFELTMARKDARLMLETAQAGGVELHVLPAIAARMDALIAAGHGADDVGVLGIDSYVDANANGLPEILSAPTA